MLIVLLILLSVSITGGLGAMATSGETANLCGTIFVTFLALSLGTIFLGGWAVKVFKKRIG
jgi:hypothetical protein